MKPNAPDGFYEDLCLEQSIHSDAQETEFTDWPEDFLHDQAGPSSHAPTADDDRAERSSCNDRHPSAKKNAKQKVEAGFTTPEAAIKPTIQRLGQPESPFIYEDKKGGEAFRVYPFRSPGGKTNRKRYESHAVHQTDEEWLPGVPAGPLPLYRLPVVTHANRVYVCMDEKSVDRIRDLGLTATTSALGPRSPGRTDWSVLNDSSKEVVLVPSHDADGEEYATKVRERLTSRKTCPTIKILDLRQLWNSSLEIPEGAEFSDCFKLGVPEYWDDEACRRHLEEVADSTKAVQIAKTAKPRGQRLGESEEDFDETADMGDTTESREKKSDNPIDLLLEFVAEADLFKCLDGKPYAAIRASGGSELYNIGNPSFELWLQGKFYLKHRTAPSKDAIQRAIALMKAKALHAGETHPVFVRVAQNEGKTYIDLANDERQVIEIDTDGWRIVDDPSVKFRRSNGMMPLPNPEQDGSLDQIRGLVNLESKNDWLMFVALVTFYLRPSGPYPLMVLQGGQGCAKSTTARIVKLLVDPHSAPLRSEPKNEVDLVISASKNWLLAMDNISRLPSWLSDALCRLTTGGGLSKRKLYTDDDETLFSIMRPVILNGITEFVERADLVDRSVFLHLPVIPEEKRREESQVKSEIASALPGAFGALLDLSVKALRLQPEVRFDRMPRMADFGRWGETVVQAMGEVAGTFMRAYTANRADAFAQILEDDPVAVHLKQLMETQREWSGTANDLLGELTRLAGEKLRGQNLWPKTPKGMSNALRRLLTVLRQDGISVNFGDRSGLGRNRRLIRIALTGSSESDQGEQQSAPSASSKCDGNAAERDDEACVRSADDGPELGATTDHQRNPFVPEHLKDNENGADGADGTPPPASPRPIVEEII